MRHGNEHNKIIELVRTFFSNSTNMDGSSECLSFYLLSAAFLRRHILLLYYYNMRDLLCRSGP